MTEDEIIVPVQRSFPNCRKYNRCCNKDENFWKVLHEKLKKVSLNKTTFRLTNYQEYIIYLKGKLVSENGHIFNTDQSAPADFEKIEVNHFD